MRKIALVLGLLALSSAPAAADPPDILAPALEALCTAQEAPDLIRLSGALGVFPLAEETLEAGGQRTGWRGSFSTLEGGELTLTIIAPGGTVRRLTVEVWEVSPEGPRPAFLLHADPGCRPQVAREIRYLQSRRDALIHYDGSLRPLGLVEPLNPPVPEGQDQGGVRVALFDSGLAYDLELFAQRLARDGDGRALGYDFAEEDVQPYDGNTARSPFFPIRHGTPVASILAREAPGAALIPYRFDPDDMTDMARIVEAAAEAGAKIISMPMGSNDSDDWEAFAAAAQERPELLFIVSAGNDGRDLDRQPLYPASLPLENIIVVTSSDDAGRLAPDVNFGRQSVDIMVPGENQPVVDFRGAEGRASGTSYAVPRVAALAARLLTANPDWTAEQLKAAILARAKPSPFDPDAPVKHGWIGNPQEDR